MKFRLGELSLVQFEIGLAKIEVSVSIERIELNRLSEMQRGFRKIRFTGLQKSEFGMNFLI